MTMSGNSSNPGRRRWLQFGLRSLLLLIALLAPLFVVLKVWITKPSAEMSVRLTKTGTVIFDGEEIPLRAFQATMQREQQLRERYSLKGTVIIEADVNANYIDVVELISQGQQAGFEKVKFKFKATYSQAPAKSPK